MRATREAYATLNENSADSSGARCISLALAGLRAMRRRAHAWRAPGVGREGHAPFEPVEPAEPVLACRVPGTYGRAGHAPCFALASQGFRT
ncbi:hypothetical protein C7S16_3826 [Burkholderia thailandensis]|uniref:Uncharacterized protein n=1 Tax=Burkholderia thailandensis TaxID=57975 RepID=A0AAW9CXN4_BURTH|nr:hypothetical protein [Burkholderia thailandensis]MDW9255395.1 hypothetical protein [Burkholderia thailandensis]